MTQPIEPVITNGNFQLYRFDNNLGAAVIGDSWAGGQGLFELSVIRWVGEVWKLAPHSQVPASLHRELDADELREALGQVRDLANECESV